MTKSTGIATVAADAVRCRICSVGKPIRSHLIPEAFIKEIFYDPKADEKHMIVHNEKGVKQASTTGWFEKGILCSDCDGVLGVYEEAALKLLRRLRHDKIGFKVETSSTINAKTYPFRVTVVDEFVRFACGILWKYASMNPTNAAFIVIGPHKQIFEDVCFRGSAIPHNVDVFIERDLFSFAAFDDPNDVYYYRTPSVGLRGTRQRVRMAWFSVSGFTIYVKMDDARSSDFVPNRCWMRGKKQCYFNVNPRSLTVNNDMPRSMNWIRPDLARLNRKLVFPSSPRPWKQ
ncbi:hypothetical protein [Sphingomonas sp. R86521]|uniref:hypothetical protein n=1 Tax=Sphingomonas sp. R86521 TaxID=3093860 RepID=UPI0036D245D3